MSFNSGDTDIEWVPCDERERGGGRGGEGELRQYDKQFVLV